MPIGTGIIYNVGDLILSQVSGSGTSFLETKIAAATSSIVYFDSTARINSASLSSLTVGTASYVSGSTSIITNLTASNISASGTSSFGMVGIGTTSPAYRLNVVTPAVAGRQTLTAIDKTSQNFVTFTNPEYSTVSSMGLLLRVFPQSDARQGAGIIASGGSFNGDTDLDLFVSSGSLDSTTFSAVKINARGSVGIGTTSPSSRLQVVSGSGSPTLLLGRDNGHSSIKAGATSNGGYLALDSDGTSGGAVILNHYVSDNVWLVTGGGNVLIGTTTSTANGGLLQIGQVPNTTASSIGFNNEDNAVISAKYNLVFQIDNTNSVASRSYEWNKGGKGYSDGTNLMTLNASGSLGIGTSSPAVNLEVVGASETLGTIRISGGKVNVLAEGEINSALEFAQRDASVAGLVSGKIASISEFSNGAYAGLGFYTAQQSRVPELKEAVRIKYDGNVGIGTTVPAYLLDVSGSSRHGYQTTDTHQFTGSVSVSGSVTAASFTGSLSGSITSALTASYLTPANSYTITNLTASNISASLTGSFGIVGIGTTSFVYSTANRGVVEIYGSNDGLLALRNSTGNLYIQKTTTDVYINNESNGFIAISNNGSERWRITNAGILQSNDAQTIQTSTGNLTLATGGGDGNILLSPNGIGKVGIGTTIPAAIVDIQGTNITIYGGSNTGSLGTMYLSGNDVYNSGTAGAGIYFRGKFDAAGTTRTTFGAISAIKENNTDGAFDGALTFFARSGSNAGIIPERMRINSNGNVGIGTTNPVAKLQVAGNISGSSFTSSISNAVGFLGTSSWAQNVVSASFATTAQTANALNTGNSYTVGSLTSTTQIGGTTGTIQSLVTPGIYSNGLSTGNAIAITSNTTFANQGAWANLGLHQTTANANDLTAKVYLAIGGWYQNSGTGLPVYIGGGYTSNSSSVLSVVPSDTAGTGNVGIGTTAPAAKLEISGSSNSALMNIKSPISGAILYVSGSGAVGIGTSNVGAYTLQVNGSFAATTKSFVIEHPTKAGKKLIYGSLESPYHGIRLTGRDTLKEGKCKIQLPDYIYKLILHDSVNIQLTGIKCNKTLYIDDINVPENYFTIAYDKAIFESYKDYDFFWDFTAIRADVPELQTEM